MKAEAIIAIDPVSSRNALGSLHGIDPSAEPPRAISKRISKQKASKTRTTSYAISHTAVTND